MTSAMYIKFPAFSGTTELPFTVRGRTYSGRMFTNSQQALSTDSIGNFYLTLENIVPDSSVVIETQLGTLIEFRTSSSSSETFIIPTYSAGSSNNNLRIKVRKGSLAPYYQAWETLVVSTKNTQSIYVSQIPD